MACTKISSFISISLFPFPLSPPQPEFPVYFLKQDGTLLAWGSNEYIQLGLGDDKLELYYDTPQDVVMMTDVIAIDGGIRHSVAIKQDGTVWVWGMNTHGVLGCDKNDVPYSFIPIQVSDFN